MQNTARTVFFIYLVLEGVLSTVAACLLKFFVLHWSGEVPLIQFYSVRWQLSFYFILFLISGSLTRMSCSPGSTSASVTVFRVCASGPAVRYSQCVITVSCLWNRISRWWRWRELVCCSWWMGQSRRCFTGSTSTNLSFKDDTENSTRELLFLYLNQRNFPVWETKSVLK